LRGIEETAGAEVLEGGEAERLSAGWVSTSCTQVTYVGQQCMKTKAYLIVERDKYLYIIYNIIYIYANCEDAQLECCSPEHVKTVLPLFIPAVYKSAVTASQ
jgi:hypothetical protein